MRILYFSSPPFADCDFPLVRQFQQMGHEVYYLIDLPCYFLRSTLIDINKQIEENGIFKASKYKEFDFYKEYMPLDKVYVINRTKKSALHPRNILVYLKLASFIKKIKPDIINVVGGIDISTLILLKFKKKLILTVHDPFPHTGEQSRRRELFRKLAMRTIPKFIILNEKQRDEFIKVYKLPPNQVYITRLSIYDCIHNFIPKEYKENTNSKNILFFGRISPYKGIEYLLKAMSIVHEKISEATLTVAGSGKMYFDITPYQNLKWVKIINRYVGMEELAGLLKDCALTVCPYTDATQSGVIMTSYSLCKPVVASNVGGLGEMVEDGKTGLLVSPKDVESLANSIITLLKDDAKREYMADNIRNDYFVGDKSWKIIANEYVNSYKDIL